MFGTPSQSGAGELLFSGGGGGLRSGSSGDAPQAGPPGPIGGLGAGTSSFDLSNDFPTLGGGGPGLGGGGVGTIGGGGGAAGLAGTLRQQQLLQQQQQQQQQQYRIATAGQGSINIAKEDFPALGSPVQQAQRSGGGDIAGLGGAGAVGSSTSNGGMNNPIFNGLAGGIASLNLHDSSASSSGGNPGGTKSSSSGGGGGPDGAPGTAINSEYGLLGLLSLIRMSESDRNALALGEDLSVLGLSLSTSARILDTFGGPFTDKVAATDFRYNIPSSYYAASPQFKRANLTKLNPESLFYMFYGMPKDAFQALAAEELYNRDWRYHGEHQLWFKRAVPGDGVDLGDGSPKYIYFDYMAWTRKVFTDNVQQIVGGFLSEDDVRVQIPANQ